MELIEELRNRREAVLSRWEELAFEVYPDETVRFIRREKDRFQNPVGHATTDALAALLEGFLDGWPPERMAEAFDGVLRIRAVQDFAPSRALEFVFLLKRALRESAGATDPAGLRELDDAVDRLALVGFDAYENCRERIFELRNGEIRRRTATLLERAERSLATAPRPEESADGKGETKGGCGS